MLCTFDGLEGQVPSRVRDAGFQFWEAAVLPAPVPWYVLSVQRRGEARELETVFVASESMLVGLLNEVAPSGAVGLLRFDAEAAAVGAWRMTRIREVWCDWRLPEGARLSFLVHGEDGLRNASLQPMSKGRRGWLIARLPEGCPRHA